MSRTAKEIILATLALAIMLVGCANDTDAPARAVVSETTAAGAVVTETTTTVTETTTPVVTTATPVTTTAKPAVTTVKPVTTAAKPAVTTAAATLKEICPNQSYSVNDIINYIGGYKADDVTIVPDNCEFDDNGRLVITAYVINGYSNKVANNIYFGNLKFYTSLGMVAIKDLGNSSSPYIPSIEPLSYESRLIIFCPAVTTSPSFT